MIRAWVLVWIGVEPEGVPHVWSKTCWKVSTELNLLTIG